jgi:hypothetical protein
LILYPAAGGPSTRVEASPARLAREPAW